MTTTQVRHRPITARQVREAIEIVAAEDPTRVDRFLEEEDTESPSLESRSYCVEPRYVRHGELCCLVALVLRQLGFAHHVIAALDQEAGPGNWRAFPTGGVRIIDAQHVALNRITRTGRQLLQWVQDEQDRGRVWSAIAKAAFRRRLLRTTKWHRENRPWLFPEELTM